MDTDALLRHNEAMHIQRIAEDPDAFADIYDCYFPRIYKYIRFRVREEEAADEITSQVFENVLTKINTFNPERGSFTVWLFAIARNTVHDYHRSRKRRTLTSSIEELMNLPDPNYQPEELLIKKDAYCELHSALAKLKDREREIVALKFTSGLTNRSIAKITGLKESNVGVILYRAMRQLRIELEGKEEKP